MNKLIYKGVEIITPVNNDIHVSGHPAQEELKLMYSWIKPKMAIPVHGEAIHINEHANIALKSGVTKVLKIKNGYLVDISKEGKVIEEVDNGKVALNGYELIPVDSVFFKERKKMLYNGVVNINILITKTGDLFELPRIKFLAVLNEVKSSSLQDFSEFIEELLHPHIPFSPSKENQIKTFLIKKIKKYLENNFNKSPSIILDIIYIEE
jgi:ribonuclease J